MTREISIEKTASCSNCGGPVRVRRPSLTGHHFCAMPLCAKVKAKTYARIRAEGGIRTAEHKAQIRDDRMIDVLWRCLGPRVDCSCGRQVVQGLPHPTPDWSEVCPESPSPEDTLPDGLAARIMKVLYPVSQP